MAQISSNWTAPTFSFDAADQPNTWIDFYYRAQDYLEVLRIQPTEEDQLKRGWEQITTMFTGENRQILQTLIDNNKITETDQRTPILALKAIETAIKNEEHHRTSTTMATKSATTTTKNRTKCPWKQFQKCIIEYMDSLHAEQCEPQMKIDIFVNAIRNTFFQQNETSTKQTQTTEQPMMTLDASTTMDLEQTSTKQTQTIEQPKMEQNPSNNTKKTANSETDDTDSAYNTEAESNYTECLPRPSSKSQQITNTKYIQGTRPSRIPIPTESNSKTSHISTLTHLPKPSTSTPKTSHPSTSTHQTKPKTSTVSTYPQHTRKTPLLPTPPSPVRNFKYSSHYKQYITRPSAFNNRNPAFTRPSPFYNRLHQQPIITRPSPIYNNFHHQPLLLLPAFTGPYPQIQGHFPQQVYYLPIILQHPIQQYII